MERRGFLRMLATVPLAALATPSHEWATRVATVFGVPRMVLGPFPHPLDGIILAGDDWRSVSESDSPDGPWTPCADWNRPAKRYICVSSFQGAA